jgi:L-threonylcarbamoyladenylate synthase
MVWYPAARWPDEAERLARAFWPGPLTLVIPCGSAPTGLLGPDGGLAVRISPDPVVGTILRRWGRPMTSTSANRRAEHPARSASEALRLFDRRTDLKGMGRQVLVIDAGPREGGRPSTIVSLVGGRPRLLREGPIGQEAIRERVPTLEYCVR